MGIKILVTSFRNDLDDKQKKELGLSKHHASAAMTVFIPLLTIPN